MSLNRNNVLMIGWEYPPHISGGLGVACEGMTKALAGANTQIYFTLPFKLGSQVSHMKVIDCYDPDSNTIEVPPFLAYAKQSQTKLSKKIDAVKLSSLPHSEIEMQVERYADLVDSTARTIKNDFDVIHAHDWMSFPAGVKLKKKTGKPLVAHVHSSEFDRIPNGKGSPYIMETEHKGMVIADRVIAVSYYTKKLLVDKYGIDGDKIDVVYNGLQSFSGKVDPGRHHFASKRPVVAFMGRLTMQKGADYFIEIAKKVLIQKPETLFVLAGSGDMYHELLFKTAANGLSASVLFSGFVRDRQKAKLLDRADVFIMPSLSEPFGLVAIEAAHHQTPVIISKNAGVGEVMKSCIAIDFWDLDKMSKTVLKIIDDKQLSKQVVDGQLKELEDITWKKSAIKIKDVYNRFSS